MRVSNQQKPLLKVGSTGKRVQVLENRLKALGYLEGKADSRFDAKTAAAVSRFKQDQGWKNPVPVVGNRMTEVLAAEVRDPNRDQVGQTPSKLRGASYNAKIGRNPAVVAKFVESLAKKNKLDFIQLQEISGYDQALKKIPGYRLITFPKSKDHGETGVLVRDGLDIRGAESVQSKIGWTAVDGDPAQPRAATKVRIAGWLNVVSVHAPPGIDWKNGKAVGPAQRIKSYGSLTTKLLNVAERLEDKRPKEALLIGGDWNEGARTGGKWSPSWLAQNAGLKKHENGSIDWEMSRGAVVSNMRRGAAGGSDHRPVLFTVSRPGKNK